MSCFVLDNETLFKLASFVQDLVNGDFYGIQFLSAPTSLINALHDCEDKKSPIVYGSAGLRSRYSGQAIFNELYWMNVRAYCGRYEDEDIAKSVPPAKFRRTCYKEIKRTQQGPVNWKIQLFKSLRCYIYQCSEDATIGEELYKAIVDLKNAFAVAIIEGTRDYDLAEW